MLASTFNLKILQEWLYMNMKDASEDAKPPEGDCGVKTHLSWAPYISACYHHQHSSTQREWKQDFPHMAPFFLTWYLMTSINWTEQLSQKCAWHMRVLKFSWHQWFWWCPLCQSQVLSQGNQSLSLAWVISDAVPTLLVWSLLNILWDLFQPPLEHRNSNTWCQTHRSARVHTRVSHGYKVIN